MAVFPKALATGQIYGQAAKTDRGFALGQMIQFNKVAVISEAGIAFEPGTFLGQMGGVLFLAVGDLIAVMRDVEGGFLVFAQGIGQQTQTKQQQRDGKQQILAQSRYGNL